MIDDPIDLDSRRKAKLDAVVMHVDQSMLDRVRIDGPFRLTVSDANGNMWDVTFPDDTGVVSNDVPILATGGPGARELIVNLLAGALKIFAGGI